MTSLKSSMAKFLSLVEDQKRTTYFFDLYNYLSYFPSFFRVRYKFGDITEEFTSPTIVKSRPINGNQNSQL